MVELPGRAGKGSLLKGGKGVPLPTPREHEDEDEEEEGGANDKDNGDDGGDVNHELLVKDDATVDTSAAKVSEQQGGEPIKTNNPPESGQRGEITGDDLRGGASQVEGKPGYETQENIVAVPADAKPEGQASQSAAIGETGVFEPGTGASNDAVENGRAGVRQFYLEVYLAGQLEHLE